MRKKILTTITATALTAVLSISAWATPYIPITEDMHDDYGVCLLGKNVEVDMLTNTRRDTYAYCYSKDLAVRVNGYLTDFPDAQPFIDKNSRTLIPLRFVTEALGADVSWDQAAKTASVEQDGIRCDITIGKADMLVTENGNTSTVTMDTQAVLKDSRTFVPIRYVAEALGAWVGWSNAYKTVEIVKGHLTPEEDELLYNTIPEKQNWGTTYADVCEGGIKYGKAGLEPWKVISEDAGGGRPEDCAEYVYRNITGGGYRSSLYNEENSGVLKCPFTSGTFNALTDDTGKFADIMIAEAEKAFEIGDFPGVDVRFRTDAMNILATEDTISTGVDHSGMPYFIRGILELTPTSEDGVALVKKLTGGRTDGVELKEGQTYWTTAGIVAAGALCIQMYTFIGLEPK